MTEGKINCIPENEENYISFTKQIEVDTFESNGKTISVKRDIRFIDSFKFMSTGLDSLVKNLPTNTFNNLSYFYGNTKIKLELLKHKGVYPYDYMDSFEKLAEKQLPLRQDFYSELNESEISENDYIHVQNVWETFEMKTLQDYHDLYLKTDVLLLADVFENFRDVCQENYKLDPAWYYTAPGLAWDAALKVTKVELELLADADMLLMIEKEIRGRVSMISTRYGKANNLYMGDSYDPNEPTKYISYLDANNLYGWAMSKPLPTHGLEWMEQDELYNWKKLSDGEGTGRILEVGLEYPKELHELHNDYPLAPELMEINKIEKLIPNLNNETKYIIHHETLKLYEKLGHKITKIHRGIKFVESKWLEPYIMKNTNLRMQAKNDFEKDFLNS